MSQNDNIITDSESFTFKAKITGRTHDNGNTKDVEISIPFNYLSKFWRNCEMPQINCENSNLVSKLRYICCN